MSRFSATTGAQVLRSAVHIESNRDVTTPSSIPAQTPSRKRMRFSLRTLFVLMTVCCAGAWYVDRCERAARAVNKIRAWGGLTEYRLNEYASAPWDSSDKPLARWIRYFWDTPEAVWLPHPREKFCRGENVRVDCGDEAIAAAVVFPNLLELKIEGRGVTNAGVRRLRTARRLREVALEGSIGDEGLAVLAALPLLEKLSLREATISVQSMQRLSKTKLQELSLSRCEVDDAALPFVPTSHLWRLDLSQSNISDAGLKKYPRTSALVELDLSGTGVTDAGLLSLPSNLQSLRLANTAISDAGAATLATMPNLYRLDLRGTRLTTIGVDRLTALPRLGYLHLDNTPLGNEVLPILKKFNSSFPFSITIHGVGIDEVGLLRYGSLRSVLFPVGDRLPSYRTEVSVSSLEVTSSAVESLIDLRTDRAAGPSRRWPGPGLPGEGPELLRPAISPYMVCD